MLIRYPPQGTSHKRLISKQKMSVKNMHLYKSHGIIKKYKGKLL